jgi:hypothetical protein
MHPRPLAISAVCVLGGLAAAYTAVVLLAAGSLGQPTLGERALGLAAVAVAAISFYGMWQMRRWGVILLAAALLARVAYGLAASQPWRWAPLAGPATVLLVGLVYFRKMT